MDKQEEKPIYEKWWFWVISIFILLMIIGAVSEKDTASISNPITNSPTSTQTSTSNVGKQYQEVFKFSGNGTKNSEPFKIEGDKFKIIYGCEGTQGVSICQAYLFEVGSSFPKVIMNSIKPISDETIMYGKGEYYISANTTGEFLFGVFDYK